MDFIILINQEDFLGDVLAFCVWPFWEIEDVETYVHTYTIVYIYTYIYVQLYIYMCVYNKYIYIIFVNQTLQWEFLYKRKFIAGKIIELFRVICQQATCDEMGGYIECGNNHDISLVGGLEHDCLWLSRNSWE